MLQSLTNSKHSTISTCSTGALKNLLASRPTVTESSPDDIGGHPSLQARKLKNMARDLDEKLLTETLDDHVEEEDSSDGDSDSVEIRHNGADCAPASRVVSRCESRDSLTSAHSDMITMKQHSDKNQPGFLAQRGGSLDRVQGDADPLTSDAHLSRHRRPAPLPLSARNQSSFLRTRQSPHQQGAAAVGPGAAADNDFRRSGNQPTGFGFENRFSEFSNLRPNRPAPTPPQPTLVNNYVFPAADNTFGFNDSNVVDDDDDVNDVEGPKNFASNDAEDDLDDKPTDYSLRFQESEEPEYMSAPPPPQHPPQPQPQQQQPQQPQNASANQNADNDDDDDDLCVDAVKSYFIEATPFDTPGRISEATSVNDLTNLPADSNARRNLVEDEDEVRLFIDLKVKGS